jgi:hypothetical protein
MTHAQSVGVVWRFVTAPAENECESYAPAPRGTR